MATKYITFKKFVRDMGVVAGALIFGIIAFAGVTIFLIKDEPLGGEQDSGELEILQYIVPALFVLMFIVGELIWKARLKKIRSEPNLSIRFQDCRQLLITRFALLEAPALFAIISLLLLGDYNYLIYVGLTIFGFGMYFPSERRILNIISPDHEMTKWIDAGEEVAPKK